MKSRSRDTSPEVDRVQVEGYRRMTPAQKLERIFSLNRTLERLASARIAAWHGPDLSERELRLRLAALRIDRDTMVRAFGWDPDVEGL